MSTRLAYRHAVPARFAPEPQRRSMIAKVHIAAKELGFDDGDYRALLKRMTGKVSTSEMNAGELGRVLDEFARLGWAPGPSIGGRAVRQRKPAPADHPAAKKARAMFISLGLLGVIRNPSEAALEAFARRQMGTTRLQWSDQAQVYKLIEALKAIAERHGWGQDVAGLADPIWTLKLRLCEAILRRLVALGVVPAAHTLACVAQAALGVSGDVLELSESDLETLARHLGEHLARHAFKSHYEDDSTA